MAKIHCEIRCVRLMTARASHKNARIFVSATDNVLAARTDYSPCERDVSLSIGSNEEHAIAFSLNLFDVLQNLFGSRWYRCLGPAFETVDEGFSFNMKKIIHTHSDHILHSGSYQ